MEYGEVLSLTSTKVAANDWVLNTGASFHTTPHKEFFKTFRSGNFGKVFLADDKFLNIIGKGDVLLKLANGNSWLLQDVKYVPQLKNNSISVGQLFSQGFYARLEFSKWKVTKESLLIAKGSKIDTLYLVETLNEVGAIHNSNGKRWHRFLKHPHQHNVEKEKLKRKVRNWDTDIRNYGFKKLKVMSVKESVATEYVTTPIEIDKVPNEYFITEIDEMEIDDLDCLDQRENRLDERENRANSAQESIEWEESKLITNEHYGGKTNRNTILSWRTDRDTSALFFPGESISKEVTMDDNLGKYIGPKINSGEEFDGEKDEKVHKHEDEEEGGHQGNVKEARFSGVISCQHANGDDIKRDLKTGMERSIVLAKEKKLKPSVEEVFGHGTETLLMDGYAQALEQHNIKSIKNVFERLRVQSYGTAVVNDRPSFAVMLNCVNSWKSAEEMYAKVQRIMPKQATGLDCTNKISSHKSHADVDYYPSICFGKEHGLLPDKVKLRELTSTECLILAGNGSWMEHWEYGVLLCISNRLRNRQLEEFLKSRGFIRILNVKIFFQTQAVSYCQHEVERLKCERENKIAKIRADRKLGRVIYKRNYALIFVMAEGLNDLYSQWSPKTGNGVSLSSGGDNNSENGPTGISSWDAGYTKSSTSRVAGGSAGVYASAVHGFDSSKYISSGIAGIPKYRFMCDFVKVIREDILLLDCIQSDKIWRRLIRSVQEQCLVKLKSSQGLVIINI